MRLDDLQLSAYRDNGLVTVPNVFSRAEVECLRAALPRALEDPSPGRVMESHGKSVRGLHGQHETIESFGNLVRHPRLIGPARQLLQEEVFVYQFKINVKAAFTGELWPWHQDFVFWQREDGMEEACLVNALVVIDDNTEFNGPLWFMEGSHREGVIDQFAEGPSEAARAPGQAEWVEGFSANLKYSLSDACITQLGRRYPLRSAQAPAGAVILFHPNLVHGSTGNMTPFDRCIILVTYGSVAARFRPMPSHRPGFLVNRDRTPLTMVHEGVLLESPRASDRGGA